MDRERRISMKRFQIEMAGVLVIFALVAVPGWAGPKHYVASYGLNTNPCTLDSPCRSFAQAVSVADAGGEVIVLDTGGYGSVTITKSISIIAPVGMYASVTVSSGSGITISAGAGDKVFIKGLTIRGTSNSLSGIRALTVGTLVVDNCFISGFACGFLCGEGIAIFAPNSNLVVEDSEIRDNNYGIGIYNTSGSVKASIDRVHSDGNGVGYDVLTSGTAIANITNSTANNNSTGFENAEFGSPAKVIMNLENCIASNNSYAGVGTFNGNSASETHLSNCAIVGNQNGILKGSSGTIYSRGNNTVVGNTNNSNVVPTAFSAW
jgi:hypothetical protein